ncbi:outer membrane beta-barrel protein [Pseudoalteromonas sp. T1lg23B]|uniref:outer membrane beta-barrel protein n=1 Tax=Pseudoalteromonas sp. T1lg23B TaxID=2077097 RepID=UPI00131A371C|nr:outer membrane beta-barrel protein [Pseudoalteromonas sp. T1lg23B]
MKKSVLSAVILSALSFASTVNAEQADNQWLWGVNISSDSIDPEIGGMGSDKATGYGLFVGKQFNKHLSVMGGYKKFGTPSYELSGVCFGCGAVDLDIDLSALYIKSRLKNTFENGFMVFADLAFNSWDADAKASYSGYSGAGKVSGSDLSFGAGVGYQNNRHEYTLGFESYDFDGTEITSVSVSYSYSF